MRFKITPNTCAGEPILLKKVTLRRRSARPAPPSRRGRCPGQVSRPGRRFHSAPKIPIAPLVAMLILSSLLGTSFAPLAAAAADGVTQSIVEEGIAIDFRMEPAGGAGALREGANATVRFTVSDTASDTPLSGLYPAAWMDLVPSGEERDEESCRAKVSSFLSGTLFSQPELDLNVFYVLALNEDGTITVVDPLFGFGTTKLLEILVLESPGEDWAFAPEQDRLFVSQPAAGKVAVVDTATWRVTHQIAVGEETGGAPARLALQGDGRYLWVGDEAGVVALDTEELEVAARVATGAGPQDLALSADGRFAYAASAGAGTVTVIDTATLAAAATVATGPRPVSIAYSELGGAAYVSDEVEGTLTVLDGESHRVSARIRAQPGLGRVRFAPGGRYGFAVAPTADRVFIVDAATRRVAQTAVVEPGPDQVSFSDELAYIHHRGSELVLMIPLDIIGKEGAPVSVIDFPGGQRPPRQGVTMASADAIVQAPGAPAVLVANPADKMIYFYKEGMAAPMGSFRNYDRQPRAVAVVDRSLRERRRPGHYETAVQLRRPGRYDVAFFLDTPRVVRCFAVEVAPAGEARPRRAAGVAGVDVEHLLAGGERTVAVGEPVELTFRLSDPATGARLADLEDVEVLTYRVPGVWQLRHSARHLGDGVYAITFTPPRPGLYHAFLAAPSRGLALEDAPYLSLEARLGEAGS